MQMVCTAGVFMGAVIMLYSIYKYYRSLVVLRGQSYSHKTFSRWTYALCMGLMLFFLAGYVALGVSYLFRQAFGTTELLISAIFFFGAVFVYVVITVQRQMSKTISSKTDEIILSLVNAMEAKDQYTRGHSVHVSHLVELFYAYLPEALKSQVDRNTLRDAAILHDIGKIGISDTILNKPGPLTEEEMAVIRQHPRMGKHILQQTSFSQLGDILLAHHERMDQEGYYRLPAENIPLESRIIAIADTFSALYSDRVYRPRRSFKASMAEINRVAGTQLDANLTAIFTAIPEEEINKTTLDLFKLEELQTQTLVG